jgi:LysM repeat protein
MVVGVVAATHVVVGMALMIQGCGTSGPIAPPPEPKMPEIAAPTPPAAPSLVVPAPQFPVANPEVKPQQPETTPYTVAKGDSLSVICKRFHVDRAEVMALNGIKDVNKLRVGQKLVLPKGVVVPKTVSHSKPAAVKPAAAKHTAVVADAAGGGAYVVKAGDSLSVIAKRHKTTSSAIRQANNIKGDRISVGQKLVIPGAAPAAPAEAAPAVPAAPDAAPAPDAPPPSEFDEMQKSAAPAGAPAAAPAAAVREHTVEQGEDLYTVAMMYGVGVKELKTENGLTDTAVAPGTRLKIPAAL